MTKLIKFLVPIIILFVIVFLFIYFGKKSALVYNPEDTAGNTPGNLLNGGLFCEKGTFIYFSNRNDDGTLYSMDLKGENFKKIYDDKVGYINAAGNFLYYSRKNYKKAQSASGIFTNQRTGIYRLNLSGTKIKQLYKDPCGIVNLYGNYVYYQHYNDDDGLKFYKVKIDGTEEEALSNEALEPISIKDNILYYTGVEINHAIYSLDLKTGNTEKFFDEDCYSPIINNDYIYYMSIPENYAIYRIDLKGGNKSEIIKERCCTYNLTVDGRYLYYQVDNNKNNRICIMDLNTMDSQTIMEGDFNGIHITSNYVFFSDFEDTTTYYSEIGSSKTASVFNPPDLSKK